MHHNHHPAAEATASSSGWDQLLTYFSEADFMPHGHCYLWKPGLVYTHVIADFIIGTAYVVIALTLYRLAKKINVGFNQVVLCFGVFIGACGWTHYNEIWNLWYSDYWYSGMVKVLTAIASAGTGVYLIKLRQPIVALAEAAKLSEQRRIDLEALQKINAQELIRLKDEFATLADNISQLAWMADASGNIFWYNKRWYEYTGTTFEEMQGWGWEKVHDPTQLKRVVDSWTRSLKTGAAWEDTFPLKGRDGTFRWFLSRAMPIKDEAGKIIRWFGTNTDIEEQRRSEMKLQKLAESLDAAVKSRDEFLSVASHELRTPLTTMLIQSQLHARLVAKGDPSAYSKDRLDQQAHLNGKLVKRLSTIVDDMLDISRIRSGTLQLNRTSMDMKLLLEEVLERMEADISEAGYALEVHAESVVGQWDRTRVDQVITNLLSNALKYGLKKPVILRLTQRGTDALLSITDHGMGIPKEAQDRIFDRFERAVDPNEISGLGLGLFIAKQIVSAHSGRIWVESTLGKGSTFFVQLPLESNA